MTPRAPVHVVALAACQPEHGGLFAAGYVRALRDVAKAIDGLTLGVTSHELAATLENQANTIRRVLRGDEAAS